MLNCMCRHPSGVMQVHILLVFLCLAIPMFASFSPGKTKIYCNLSENSLIFFLIQDIQYIVMSTILYVCLLFLSLR